MHTSPPSGAPSPDRRLEAKIAELREKKHLPEQMVSIAAAVTRLHHAFLPRVCFNSGRERLDALIQRGISPPEKRAGGLPILPGGEFPLDMPLVTELAKELLRALPEKAPALAPCAPLLAARIEEPGILEAACREAIDLSHREQDLPLLGAWAKEHPEAPLFFRFIATSAALPCLIVVGGILGEAHDKERIWPHGHCPVCGNQPLIGRLADKEGRRLHTCSLCGFEYRAPRLGCPFCLAPESEGAEYHVSEDERGYLLTVCKSCKTYFKLGDFRECDRYWFPLLDDLASLTLDIYAAQLGCRRPTLSGWGF
jgi:FdhE protein